ncbi:MAG: hypothetical protein KGL97_05405, partial [Alphaproteobacteria bacterium]|nr:hypothetical protein [Alphaproteobacteria bacterium]
SPICDTLIEGFSHFVTSMTAPIASGWSEVAGRASHPLESAALSRRTPSSVIRQKAEASAPKDVVRVCIPQTDRPASPAHCASGSTPRTEP